ncbi:MAG: hypothetical protein ACU841_09575 [Gammaproteobacteria bacterium]
MTETERPKFAKLMAQCAAVYRQEVDVPLLEIFWQLLQTYPLSAVEQAFRHHMRISRFFPTPAELISGLDDNNARLSADEAWALMPADESETVVWTDEMAEAHAVAFDLLAEGDTIGARMAFRAAYERLCREAIRQNRPVCWFVSLGHDKRKVAQALDRAVELGRIGRDEANRFLPAPMEGRTVGRFLTGKVVDVEIEKNRKTVARLRSILTKIGSNPVDAEGLAGVDHGGQAFG